MELKRFFKYENKIFIKKKNNLIPSFLELVNNNLDEYGHRVLERACKDGVVEIVKNLYKTAEYCNFCLMYALKLKDPEISDLLTEIANPVILSSAFHYGLKKSSDWARSVIRKVIPEKVIDSLVDKRNYWMINILFDRKLNINKSIGLQAAARNGDMKMVKYLIERGASNFNKALYALCDKYIYLEKKYSYLKNDHNYLQENYNYLENKYTFFQEEDDDDDAEKNYDIRDALLEMAKYLISVGADNIKECMEVASGELLELLKK